MKKHSFYIEPFAPFGLFVLFFVCEKTVQTAMISSVFVHEAAHLIAALFCGERIQSVRLTSFGISLGFSNPKSYGEEAFVAICGPMISFLFAATGRFGGGAFGEQVCTFSAFLGLINLFPLPTFDGWRVLRAAISCLFGLDAAERAAHAISMVCLFAAWVMSIYILFYSGANFALLLFCSYIFAVTVIKRDCIYKEKMI